MIRIASSVPSVRVFMRHTAGWIPSILTRFRLPSSTNRCRTISMPSRQRRLPNALTPKVDSPRSRIFYSLGKIRWGSRHGNLTHMTPGSGISSSSEFVRTAQRRHVFWRGLPLAANAV